MFLCHLNQNIYPPLCARVCSASITATLLHAQFLNQINLASVRSEDECDSEAGFKRLQYKHY